MWAIIFHYFILFYCLRMPNLGSIPSKLFWSAKICKYSPYNKNKLNYSIEKTEIFGLGL